MHLSIASLPLILLSLSAVDAKPLSRRTGKATLSFATKINDRDTLNIADKDHARVQAMKQLGQLGKRSTSVNITQAMVFYTAEVGVGDPATTYTLLIDTGSSNTFVGAQKPYTPTNTSQNTGESVFVPYGSGYFSGEEWLDTVTLAPDLVIRQQSIGVASSSSGFTNLKLDGILGLGPVDLTSGTINNTNTAPTVSDNLLIQGMISEEVLGIYFGAAGELTFGGYDGSVITSPVNYVPLTTISPASQFWGIDQSISYGGTTIMSLTAGIVDTGTTLMLIPTEAFQQYQSMTGGVLDAPTGLLSITAAQYANLQPLTFSIGGNTYDLSPNGQIWPRSLNTAIGGSSTAIYLIVNDLRTPSGQGLDFVNGYSFLLRFYSVYDTANGQVGFASTAHTASTSN